MTRTGSSLVEWLMLLLLAAIVGTAAWLTLGTPAHADLRGMGVFAPKPAAPKTAPDTWAAPVASTTATKALPVLPSWLPGVEAGACLSIGPDQEQLGARVGLGLFNFPDSWSILAGRRLYADAITVEGVEKFAVGLSMSLMPSASDNNLRIGLAWWRVGGEDKLSGYISYPVMGF